MITECPYCESKVDAKIIGRHESGVNEDDPYPTRTSLLGCPVCQSPLVTVQEQYQTGPDEYEWSNPTRVWAQPDYHPDWEIPEIVRNSLEEAHKCLKAKAYSACAVMCGRSLEGICKKFGTKNKMLAGGLKELRQMKVIDDRLFQWGEALREHRNIGAHASETDISKDDASDLVDFVDAICEYVFVLTDKYNQFMKRKKKK